MNRIPNSIYSGKYCEGHVQGIAIDEEHGYVYYSFTTVLLKTDLKGTPVGCVNNLAGHLGCIAFDKATGHLYGSLEFKHDAIGKGIMARTGRIIAEEDAFYIASFECDKIDRMDLDAEKDGVMRAAYLRDVVKDFLDDDEISGKKHRYGCSGIDGISVGPAFGDRSGEDKIMVAYGIYGDTERGDNDHQVILQFAKKDIESYSAPLSLAAPHHTGPAECEKRYFFYTGNTTYGIQNLEYDSFSGNWFAAVYAGKKESFANFNMFVIDGNKAPAILPLAGRGEERGHLLYHAGIGEKGKGGEIYGSFFPYGSTGMISLGDGLFCFSENGQIKEEKAFYTYIKKYRYSPERSDLFEPAE